MKSEESFGHWMKSFEIVAVISVVGAIATGVTILQSLKIGEEHIPKIVILVNFVGVLAAFGFSAILNHKPTFSLGKTRKSKQLLNNYILEEQSEELDFLSNEYSTKYRPDFDKINQDLAKVRNDFINQWTLAWLSYLAIYSFKAAILVANVEMTKYLYILDNALNNLGTTAFLCMFITLKKRTSDFKFRQWAVYFIFMFILSFSEFLVALSGRDPHLFFSVLSGIFAAVVVCAFVGSIDSYLVNLPYFVIICLYAYGAMQVLHFLDQYLNILVGEVANVEKYVINLGGQEAMVSNLMYLAKETTIISWLFVVLLVLKMLLFLVGLYLIKTKKLDYMIIEKRNLLYTKKQHYDFFCKVLEDEKLELESANRLENQ